VGVDDGDRIAQHPDDERRYPGKTQNVSKWVIKVPAAEHARWPGGTLRLTGTAAASTVPTDISGRLSIRNRPGSSYQQASPPGLNTIGRTLTMAKYMLLIFGDDQQWSAMTRPEQETHDAAHRAFNAAAGAAVIGGEELHPAPMATTLRMNRAGRVIPTDGPFLETKEAIGGYYLLEAADLDAVIALAMLLPEVSAGHSGVEIRPVVDHG
jgi:hypothetical protein